MNHGVALTRRTPMPRSRPTVSGAESHARTIVTARSAGVCETGCGRRATDWSHRVARSQGGPWTPENGLHMCHGCHTWAHAHPAAAGTAGLHLPSGTDPAAAPVWLAPVTAWPGWWLLTPDGVYAAHDTDHERPALYPTRRNP